MKDAAQLQKEFDDLKAQTEASGGTFSSTELLARIDVELQNIVGRAMTGLVTGLTPKELLVLRDIVSGAGTKKAGTASDGKSKAKSERAGSKKAAAKDTE